MSDWGCSTQGAVGEAEGRDEDAAVAEWEAAQDADVNVYMQRLVHIMEEEEKEGNRDFKNFSKTMDAIESNFKLVAVECAKREGSSPFHAFDSYWALHLNFDTQGYYLRQAYRTSTEFQLRRGYSLLAAYYDMASYDAGWNSWLAERGGNVSPQNYLGLGVNHEVVGDRWVTRYVPFDAKGYQLREYDEDNNHGVIFLLNN